jgi:hypothetical protein
MQLFHWLFCGSCFGMFVSGTVLIFATNPEVRGIAKAVGFTCLVTGWLWLPR